MTVFSVYMPPLGTTQPPAETFRLVPDKKSAWALVFPVFWLLYHRLWLALLAYLVVSIGIFLLFSLKPHVAIAYLSGFPGLYLFLEGQELVSRKLERLGWRFAGIVEADDKEEAEIRFLLQKQNKEQLDQSPKAQTLYQDLRHQPHRGMNKNLGGLFPE